LEEAKLHTIIKECQQNKAHSQRILFNYMYNYGMNVASRYGKTTQEAEEIANDGFYKALKYINKYDFQKPFLVWVRRIIINSAIDHFRKNERGNVLPLNSQPVHNTAHATMNREYLESLVHRLPDQQKMVFMLHVMEEFTHDEIAKELKISKGTSKSNLAKARKKLQQMIAQVQKLEKENGA